MILDLLGEFAVGVLTMLSILAYVRLARGED